MDREVCQVPYSITGISAMWLSCDGRAEHGPHRRQHAELDAGRAAGGHDPRQGRLVELGHGEDHALDVDLGHEILAGPPG